MEQPVFQTNKFPLIFHNNIVSLFISALRYSSRPLLLERKMPLDKKIIQVSQTLILKRTIRKQEYNSLLLKIVSSCYCYCSATNGISVRSES